MRSYFFILCIALNPQSGDFSGAILEVPSEALLHLSVISRSSLGEIWQGIREVNLKNSIVFGLMNAGRVKFASGCWIT